ncbi:MAG: hypothetical protein ACI4JB_03210 [Porcipelethomonas sp.]
MERIRKFCKDPVKFNLLVLTAFPLIFIFTGFMGYSSDRFRHIFFSPHLIYGSFIAGLIEKMGCSAGWFYKISAKVLYTYPFWFLIYGVLLILEIFAWGLYMHGRADVYRRLTITVYFFWIFFAVAAFIQTGIMLVNTVWIIAVFVLFLPAAFLLSSGIGKTVSVKTYDKQE